MGCLAHRYSLYGIASEDVSECRVSVVDERSDVFAVHDLLEVADDVHVEDVDGEVVLLAHRCGGEVHDFQSAGVDLVVGDVGELCGGRIFLGVGGVDAVDAGAFEHDVGLNLDAAQRRAGVGGEVGAARAGREDADVAGLHGLDGAPLGVELADGLHADGGQDAGLDADCAEGRAEGEGVDDGGAHAHLVAFDAVEAFLRTAEAAEDVAAADDDADLDAHVGHFLDLAGVVGETFGVDAEVLAAHEAFATEFQ